MQSLLRATSLFFLLVPSISWSSLDLTDQFGVRSRGMGGAGRAVVTTNETMYLNPAGMSQYARFDMDVDYVFRFDNPIHLVGLTLVDSTTTPFAGGVGFHMGIDPQAPGESLSYLGSVALSFSFIEDVLLVGATGKYAYLPATASEPLTMSRFGLDAGLLMRVTHEFSLAATGYNLIPTDSNRLPLSVGFGAAMNLGKDVGMSGDLVSALKGFAIAFDWLLRDLTSANGVSNELFAGAEMLLFDSMPVRVGYSYALKPNEHEVSVGLGYIQKNFGVEGFYEQNLTTTTRRGLGFVLRMFL